MTQSEVVAAIYVEGVCRRQLHSAEKRLGLQIKAILRLLKRRAGEVDGDATEDQRRSESQNSPVQSVAPHESEEGAAGHALREAQWMSAPAPSVLDSALGPILTALDAHRSALKTTRLQHEKVLAQLAQQLPVWSEWLAGQRGCSALGLALIVAETGNLSNYANVAKVWKRLGLAVINGEGQRRVTDPAGAKLHGYSPRRRAVAWNMGESFVKQGDRYRALYLQRKAIEAAKPSCGKSWRTASGGQKRCEKDGHCLPKHVHARARRWVEKKFLAHLWGAWTRRPEPLPRAS
jgi:hypothetical protein